MMAPVWKSAVTFALVGSVSGFDWANQVNVSICSWAQFRANVIRDTIYLDGGFLWSQRGLSNGQPPSTQTEDTGSVIYTLNLGQPFGPATNLTGLFKTMPKYSAHTTDNITRTYYDGVMFANYDELILYGGLTRLTDSVSSPPPNETLGYEAYQYGPESADWVPDFNLQTLPSNVTPYVTNGAGVSAPSENLGYYFSGMGAPDGGLIQDPIPPANTIANTLITVDMSIMGQGSWTNSSLGNISGRANAELVWVPVSTAGILIAIGGVINPVSLAPGHILTQSQIAASKTTNPTFMKTVSIFDIVTAKWYHQDTSGQIPPPLTQFCSVVAAASDGSSYNIYIYGGYDGINATGPESATVYVLSVPSFTWTNVYTGDSTRARIGHKCFAVYPDQMFVIGGVLSQDPTKCLGSDIIQVFNLNSLLFQDTYSPLTWSNYTVPSVITAKIGGNGQGGATVTAPSAWNDSALATVFQSPYTGTIQTYYPYALVNVTTPTPSPGPISIQSNGGGGFPNWAGAVLGVVLGLGIVAGGALFWVVYVRRKSKESVAGSHRSSYRGQILNWLMGTPLPVKSGHEHRVSELSGSYKEEPGRVMSPVSEADSSVRHELPSMALYELAADHHINIQEPEPILEVEEDRSYEHSHEYSDEHSDEHSRTVSRIHPS